MKTLKLPNMSWVRNFIGFEFEEKKPKLNAYIQFDNDDPIPIMEDIDDDVVVTFPYNENPDESYVEFTDSTKGKKFKIFLAVKK